MESRLALPKLPLQGHDASGLEGLSREDGEEETLLDPHVYTAGIF